MHPPPADNSASLWTKATPIMACSMCIFAALPVMVLLIPKTTLVSAEIQRLPPVRLPRIGPLANEATVVLHEADDIIQLAGGAVELRVRQGWWIWEVPMGREVRVALSPTRPASMHDLPDSGYWVCFHLNPSKSPNPQDLERRIRQRLMEVSAGNAEAVNTIQFRQIGPWDAAEVEFFLPASTRAETGAMRGSHVLVNTPWGLFEFHMQFPADHYEEHLDEVAGLLRQVTLTAPRTVDVGRPNAETAAASPIYGSWKAFRSRMRLGSDGSIEIALDHVQLISPLPDGPLVVRNELVQGRYRADSDLLFVQWRDGSKLNFRWAIKGEDLLLTDHEGQISQLRRIAE